MARSNSVRAGRAFVELFADDSKLVRGLRAAEKRLKAFGDRISQVGDPTIKAAKAIVKVPVAAYVQKVYEEGDFAGLGIGTS